MLLSDNGSAFIASELKKYLDEQGAYSEEELSNHHDNLMRIIWIASFRMLEEM